jgi:uncharacterized membrane protein YdbT with pleckstrin-like domain
VSEIRIRREHMDSKEAVASATIPLSAKESANRDMKSLWDRWDKAHKEETPTELVRGSNLVGVLLIIVGALLQTLGSGFLNFRIAPIVILIGAAILAVKKFRTLWSQRSLNS